MSEPIKKIKNKNIGNFVKQNFHTINNQPITKITIIENFVILLTFIICESNTNLITIVYLK